MKKVFTILLMALAIMTVFVSCDDAPHVHQFSSDWSHDDTYHWHPATCGDTEEVDSKGEHVWEYKASDNGAKHIKTCKTCGYSIEEVHNLEPYMTEDKSKHYQECKHCDYKTEETDHTFTAAVTEDKSKHQESCSVCGYKKDATAHVFPENWTIDKDSTEDEQGLKHRTCSVCDYKETEVIGLKDHTHKWKSEYSWNTEDHWHDCEKYPKCTVKGDNAKHNLSYVNNKADGHYQKCNCGYTTKKENHSLTYKVSESGEAHYQECETCGYKTEETEHVYDIVKSGPASHWKECICGKKLKIEDGKEYASHTFSTVIRDGKAIEACSGCDYTRDITSATVVVTGENSLAEVVNAENVETVKYGNDITITKDITLKKTITIDMAGKSMTVSGGAIEACGDIIVTVKNIPDTVKDIKIAGLDVVVKKEVSEENDETSYVFVYYPALKAAVEDAGATDAIALQNDVTLAAEDGFEVKKAINLVLCKNALKGEENITLKGSGSIAVYESATTQKELAFAGAVAKLEATGCSTYYPTLPNAINAAKDNDAIKLLDDVALRYTTGIEKSLTLDLNGKKITKTGSSYPLKVKGEGVALTIKGNGTISATDGAIWVFDKAKVVIENGTYSGKYAIEVGKYDKADSSASSGGQIEIRGGTFTSTENTVHVWENSSAKISGGTFTATDNAVIGTDGSEGLKNCSYTIDISGGTFNGYTTKEGYIACGIYLANTGTVNLSGGKFNIEGGVGVLVRSGTLNASGGTISLTEKSGLTSGKVGYIDVDIKTGAQVVVDTTAKYPGAEPKVATNTANFAVKDTTGNDYSTQ